MAGRSTEAEKMTLGIISKTANCIECYRLLSAIFSKQGNHTEVCVCMCANSRALAFIAPSQIVRIFILRNSAVVGNSKGALLSPGEEPRMNRR